jgi:hypothetical protein
MTMSRTAVYGLLLGLLLLLLWLPAKSGAQGTVDCRAAMNNLFVKAADLSIDYKTINDELTSLPVKCKVKESDSVIRLPKYREQIKAEKEEDDRSHGRLEKSANWYNQAPAYDPNGMSTRWGRSMN